MSHHLKVLAQAGLVATRREGNAIFYRRALAQNERVGGTLHAALLTEVDELELPTEIGARIADVHAQREAVSRDFFARAAEKFQAQQDLIAGLPQYRESVLALLDALGFPSGATALEVGPGDGGFLPDLARRFAHVTALDNSMAMLELARMRCNEEGLGNVELRLADALNDEQAAADCVVLNMVLHHFAAPADAMKQLAQRVQPGGSLLVTELCSHNQSWAREACGDLWLGFEQDDLARWANAAGLTPGESLYIGLRNGFQIQVRHFAKPDSRSELTHR
jgi:ArsR family transcriptional regulator